MSVSTVDIRARLRAIPFVMPPPPPALAAAAKETAAEAASEASAQKAAAELQGRGRGPLLPTGRRTHRPGRRPARGREKSGEWKKFSFNTDIFPEEPIILLDKSIEVLQKVLDIITPILKLVQLFLSSFASFSMLVKALISGVKTVINQWLQDLLGSGVYMNILVPPTFVKGGGNFNYKRMATGGFNGFMGRLSVSMYNRADPNRPIFTPKASVGGFIILVDAESPDEFFTTLKALNNLFSFMDTFPLHMEFPPPVNVRTVYGKFVSKKYPKGRNGVQLKWDAPPGFGGLLSWYRISRSKSAGGILTKEHKIPDKLGGPDGFIRAVWKRIVTVQMGGKAEWPEVITYAYNDKTFNGGQPKTVKANPINGGGTFIDYDIPTGDDDPKQYYYVIESGFPGMWGSRCSEISVPIEEEYISENSIAVIKHGNGSLEKLSPGIGALGFWSSIQMRHVIPFMPLLVDLLNKLMNSIEGMIKTSNDSFSSFLDGLVEKLNQYKQLIEILLAILEQMKKISLGPAVAFLYVPPETGGVNGFLSRVKSAKIPDGGFTGPNGITAGIVFLLGAAAKDPYNNSDEENLNKQAKALDKSFNLLMDLLT